MSRLKIDKKVGREVARWILDNDVLKESMRIIGHRNDDCYELEFTDKPIEPNSFTLKEADDGKD